MRKIICWSSAVLVLFVASCSSHHQMLLEARVGEIPTQEAINNAQTYYLKNAASGKYMLVDPLGGIDARNEYPLKSAKINFVESKRSPGSYYLMSSHQPAVFVYTNDERKIKAGHFGYGDHALFTIAKVERLGNQYWRLHSVRYPEIAIGFNKDGLLRDQNWEDLNRKETLFEAVQSP